MKKLILLIFISVISTFAQSNDESWKLYDDSEVARVDVSIDTAALAWLYNDTNILSDSLHLASFHFKNKYIDETVDSVGFRLRGNTSRSAKKKSFKISFNTFVSGREFYGVDKLNLNGEHNDPSIIRSKMCWDLFKKIGVISSRSSYAEVYINGLYYGLYISVEHVDNEFLKKNFSDDSGNLWKCLFPADLTYKGDDPNSYKFTDNGRPVYDLKSNESADDYSQLARLISIINSTPDNLFLDSLDKILDVASLLKYFAVNNLTGSWDNYWSLMNNYYLYHNPTKDKFDLIPYDYDNSFGVDWFNVDWSNADPYNYPRVVDGSRPLAERILNNSELKTLYTHFLDFYNENVFKLSYWNAKIDSIKNMITPYADADTFRTKDYGFSIDDFNQSYSSGSYSNQHVKNGLKQFVNLRYNSLKTQLNYGNANPIVYALNYYPIHPGANDSIHIVISAYSHAGIDQAEINFTKSGVTGNQSYPLLFQPISGSNKVEDADRWIGTIPPLGQGASGYFTIKVKDVNQNEIIYPGYKSIEIKTPSIESENLIINEFMASNSATISDTAGGFDDWIELYNPTTTDVALSGMYLTDKPDNLTKWKFSEDSLKIKAGEYLIIWCDEEQEQGSFHTNFKLSTGGEFIALTESDGVTVIDSISFGLQRTDTSFGRFPDASDSWQFFSNPTPGESNLITGIKDPGNTIKSFELNQNFPNPFNPTTKIRYSIPLIESPFQGGARGGLIYAQLNVYNILGGEVATLVNKQQPPGNYEITFNAVNLPSGVYFYQLKAGDFIQTKKMLLLK